MIQKEKITFSSRMGFIAAASGSAIGLGNIWKFPYEVGSHGGAGFFIPYILFMILLGYPMLLTKAAFGRKIGKGVYDCYKTEGKWNVLGFMSMAICIFVLSFYNVVTGWILGYVIHMAKGTLLNNSSPGIFFSSYIKDIPLNLLSNTIITLVVVFIVKVGVKKGIEKCSNIIMPIFIILLFGLISYAITLPGSYEGIKFYLWPTKDFLNFSAISSALSQCFMSLALGSGVMITYGAYVKRNSNLSKDSFIVVLSDFFVAFLAGLLVFPLIFHKNISPDEGPALIFVALPFVFKSLGAMKGTVMGISFFTLLIFAAITSAISQLEVSTKYIMERWNFNRSKGVYIAGFISYILGIGSLLSHGGANFFTKLFNYKNKYYSFMDTVITVVVDFAMPMVALLFCIFIGIKWNKYNIDNELKEGMKSRYSDFVIRYTFICVKYVSPILIIGVLFFKVYTGSI